jgi:hypothetical protein
MAGRKPNPWASFILRAGQVHENSDGTRIWAAIPADGITTLQRDVKTDAVGCSVEETILGYFK